MKNYSIIIFSFYFWWSVLTPNSLNTFPSLSFLDIVDEVILLMLTFYVILVILKKENRISLDSTLLKMFGTFFFLITISFIVNKSGVTSYIQFLLIYYRPIIIVLFSAIYFSVSDTKKIVKYIIYLFALQVLLNVTWILGVNPIPHWKHYVDISTGTFESVMPVAYFCVFILYYIIGSKIVLKKNINNHNKIHEIIFIVILFIQLYITFTSHAIILGVIGLSGFFVYHTVKLYKYIIIGLIIFIVIIFSFKQWEAEQFHASTSEILTPAYIVDDRFDRLEQSVKILSFYRILTNDVPEIKTPLLGAGPGNYASLVAARGSDLYRKYNDVDRLKAKGVDVGDTTSVTGGVHSGALALLGDIGWLGYLNYFLILIYGLIKCISFIRSKKLSMVRYPQVLISFVPATIFYFLLDIIWDLGAFKIISIGYWVWYGLVMKEIFSINNGKKVLKIYFSDSR